MVVRHSTLAVGLCSGLLPWLCLGCASTQGPPQPSWAEPLQRIHALLQAGELSAGLTELDALLTKNPEDMGLRAYAVSLLGSQPDPRAKQRHAALTRELADLPAFTPQEFYLRAHARRGNGDRRGALADLDYLQKVVEPSAEQSALRAVLHYEGGDAQAALGVYDEALARWPQHEALLFQRGMLRRRLGQVEDAEADLRAAVAAGGRNPWVRFRLAALYLESGRPDQCLEVAGELLAALPAPTGGADGLWVENQLLRSRALLLLQREAEAEAVLREVEALRGATAPSVGR